MYRKISDCTSKIKHRDPRDTGAQIYARGVYRHFRWYFLNYSIKFIIHMRVTYVCMCGLSAYILTYTCNTGTRSSFIYEFSSLFFFFLSFVNSILIFFFFIFYSFTFFFLLLFHFNLFRFRKRRSKSVVRDLTKESELSRVCTKGCKSITTSRNVSKSFS